MTDQQRWARRASWSIADQGLSSLTNFALAIVAARQLDADDFGGFAAALGVYLLAVGATRATCGELVIVRYGPDEAKEQAPAALGAALAVGLPVAVVALAASLLLDGPLGPGLAALALTLPGLLLQDTVRYVFVAEGRPSKAFVNDAVWTIAQVGAIGFVIATDRVSVGSLMLAWGLAGSVAAATGLVQARCVPRLRTGVRWFRTNRRFWPRYLTEFAATMGAWQTSLFLVGGIAGLSALGGLRAAQVLYGPLHVIYYGARLAVVPEGVRSRNRGDHRAHQRALLTAGALVALALIWTAVVAWLPDSFGEALLGASWADTSQIRVSFGLFMMFEGASVGAIIGLRILLATGSSLRAASLAAITLIGLAAFGATTGSLASVGWCLVAAGALGTGAWWFQLRKTSDTVALVPEPGSARAAGSEQSIGE